MPCGWGFDPGAMDPLVPTVTNPIVSGTIIGKEIKIETATMMNFQRYIDYGKRINYSGHLVENTNAFLTARFDKIEVAFKKGSYWGKPNNFTIQYNNPNRNIKSLFPPSGYTKGYILAYQADKNVAFALFSSMDPSTDFQFNTTVAGSKTTNPLSDACIWLCFNEHVQVNVFPGMNPPRRRNFKVLVGTYSEVTKALRLL